MRQVIAQGIEFVLNQWAANGEKVDEEMRSVWNSQDKARTYNYIMVITNNVY